MITKNDSGDQKRFGEQMSGFCYHFGYQNLIFGDQDLTFGHQTNFGDHIPDMVWHMNRVFVYSKEITLLKKNQVGDL